MIKSAVIGIGGIGKWHGAMMRDTKRMEIRAVCDANDAMREVAAKEFPGATYYTKPEEMFANEPLDLVTLATPHILHAPLAIAAVKAGINVISEKPMATRYEDAVAMVAAARAADRFVTVFHNRRLDPWFLAAKSVVVDDRLLGEILELNTGIMYGAGPQTWRGYKHESGGLMFDWGAHLVDYMLNLANSEVKSVSGHLRRIPGADPKRNEDYGTIRILFASGAVANVTCCGTDRIQPLRYRIIGERGTLHDEWKWGDDGKLKVAFRLSTGDAAEMEVAYRKSPTQAYYDNIAAHMLDGKPLLVSGESAAKVINVLCTAERSSAQGGTPLPLA